MRWRPVHERPGLIRRSRLGRLLLREFRRTRLSGNGRLRGEQLVVPKRRKVLRLRWVCRPLRRNRRLRVSDGIDGLQRMCCLRRDNAGGLGSLGGMCRLGLVGGRLLALAAAIRVDGVAAVGG